MKEIKKYLEERRNRNKRKSSEEKKMQNNLVKKRRWWVQTVALYHKPQRDSSALYCRMPKTNRYNICYTSQLFIESNSSTKCSWVETEILPGGTKWWTGQWEGGKVIEEDGKKFCWDREHQVTSFDMQCKKTRSKSWRPRRIKTPKSRHGAFKRKKNQKNKMKNYESTNNRLTNYEKEVENLWWKMFR